MELFAIGVVIILFMAVLKQFGILEPMSSFEGKGPPEAPGSDVWGKMGEEQNGNKLKGLRELWSQFASPV